MLSQTTQRTQLFIQHPAQVIGQRCIPGVPIIRTMHWMCFIKKNELVATVTNGYKVKRLYMYDTSCENTPSCIMVVS